MKNEAKPRVYDILAKAFAQEDVRTCFALLGDANMNWAARLSEEGCRMVYVRHEHCALAAAMAYSRKNWEVGVATVTCGRSEEHTSELQSQFHLVCRLLLEKKNI